MNVRKGVVAVRGNLFGSQDHVAVDRALAEFRSGRPVVITSGRDEARIVLPVEALDSARWLAFAEVCAPAKPILAVSRQRARSLGAKATGPVALKLPSGVSADQILSLAADVAVDDRIEAEPLGAAAAAGIDLAKLAQGLPAVLAAPVPNAAVSTGAEPITTMRAEAIAEFRRALPSSLRLAAQTDVPLQGGISAHFAVFSDAIGRTHTAVIVGRPNFADAVPVRLHSACLTGDVFHSRRCDCGDQLRLSLARLQEAGGGIVLYLAQEGRGLGLANKMRAYRLQDAGLDTVDANTVLGFEYDERDYSIAARMLEMLGCSRVMLLSNNPAKVAGLGEAGIEVRGHMPLVVPVTPENRRYLTAKATRAGHKLGELMEDHSDS
jgi:GTP cyclohydrolase II